MPCSLVHFLSEERSCRFLGFGLMELWAGKFGLILTGFYFSLINNMSIISIDVF
ncbi:hypothetical protein Hanom_Chr14g01318021 [Helianthus anomalus]